MLELLVNTPLQQTLAGILLTLLAYRGALYCYQKNQGRFWLHPLITAPALIALVLSMHTSYDSYFASTALLTAALGPATVALAIPLSQQAGKIRKHSQAVLITALAGAGSAVLIALLLAASLGAEQDILRSLATKSVTTPIAIALSELIAGIPQLATGAVIITGITGAALGPPLLHRIGIDDDRVIGFTLGLTAHGVGTARAFEINVEAGTWASLGMGLTGILTAGLLPLFF